MNETAEATLRGARFWPPACRDEHPLWMQLTFVVDKRGVIRHKIIGAITPEIVEQRLLPLVRRLESE